MSAPTPLLDFFKRGEVARDVRLLAAEGTLAPRPQEQLSILMLLLSDADPQIRGAANDTLNRIPPQAVAAFLARAEVPGELRAFFASRGILPADIAAEDAETPLIDTEAPAGAPDSAAAPAAVPEEETEENRESVLQQLATMTFPERLKAAMKGSREFRSILIRDPNKMIAAAVLSSPRLTQSELEAIARNAGVSEDVLRIIAHNRAWTKNYKVALGLTKNPKTPLAVSMNLLSRLNDRDVTMLAVDRNVPEPLRVAARKKAEGGAGHRDFFALAFRAQ